MRMIFLLAGAVVWACSAMAAEQRVSLAGYQDYTFGTPEAELRTRIRVTSELPDRTAGTWLHSAETVQIDGDTFGLGFKIKDGSLAQVELFRSWAENTVACRLEFLDVIALLQARYGMPDQRPDVSMTAGSSLHRHDLHSMMAGAFCP